MKSLNIEYLEKLLEIVKEFKMESDIKYNKLTSFEVLWIYFSKKSQFDKERILRDAAFGC